MFSQYRFVLVSEADEFDEDKMETLLEYIQNPSPSHLSCNVAQTLGLWKRHRSEIEKVGKVHRMHPIKG